jgi:hypothetical protein
MQFDADTPYTLSWTSKVFESPKPANYGALQVIADSYPVTVAVLATDTGGASYTDTYEVPSSAAIRMTSGFLARDWKFTVSGTNVVQAVLIAESITELQSV